MSNKITENKFSKYLFCWFYNTAQLPFQSIIYQKKLTIMYLLIIPYWILTLPGCFLEGSFCNKRRMNKLGLTIIGYFLLLVAGCMLLYPLSFFTVLPNSKTFRIIIYFSKGWLIISAYSLIIIGMEFIKSTIMENKSRYEEGNEQLETRIEVLGMG